MKNRIFIISVLALSALFIFAGGALARNKPYNKAFGVLPVDGAEPPQAYAGPTPVMFESIQSACDNVIDSSQATILQADQWAMTYYGYQQTGSMGRMITVGPAGHRQMICHETRGPYGTQYPRYITWNCKDPLGNWFNTGVGVKIDGGTGKNAGYPNIASLHDGRAVVCYHRTGGTPAWDASLTVQAPGQICTDDFPHKYDLPDVMPGATEEGMWPKMNVLYDQTVDTDYIHIVVTEGRTSGGNMRLGYMRCHFIAGNQLLCETPLGQPGVVSPTTVNPDVNGCGSSCPIAYFGEVSAPGVPAGRYPNTISAVVATSPASSKVAIVFINKRESGDVQVNNDVYYFESTNNGIEWFPQFGGTWPPTQANGMVKNVTNYPTSMTERAYTDVSACYDYEDHLHIVWNSCYRDSVTADINFNARLMHWTDTKPLGIANATQIASGYWDDGTINCGGWTRILSKMSVSARPGGGDSVHVFCTWPQFNLGDNSAGYYTNGEIYGSVSNDSGRTWAPGLNLTHTRTPNCAAGNCLSEHWSSMAENMYDGDLHIEYVCDRDAGDGIRGGEWTDNPMMYIHVDLEPPPIICGLSYTLVDPVSWIAPPIKVVPGQQRIIAMNLTNLSTGGVAYIITTDNPAVVPTLNGSGYLAPQQTRRVELTITAPSQQTFLKVKVTITYCIGTPQQGTKEIPLFIVVSDKDYYECYRASNTKIEKDNYTLKLWVCVNSSQWVKDKRVIIDGEPKQALYHGSAVVASRTGSDTWVAREEFQPQKTYLEAWDTINVVRGSMVPYIPTEPCTLQKIHVERTFFWDWPKVMAWQDPPWRWFTVNKEIFFFHGPNCPAWKKTEVIKHYWVKFGREPLWWPNYPLTYTGHEDIYFGYFADIDAPADTPGTSDNTAGYENDLKIYWQKGKYHGVHPEYDNYYVGLALTNSAGAVVAPIGAQNVKNSTYIYPTQGWVTDSLYRLGSTLTTDIQDPDSVVDRTWVLTKEMIPAGTDTIFQSEFVLIEAFIKGGTGTGLTELRQKITDDRNILIPELNQLGLFNKKFPICGDCNGDGVINSADIVCKINYLFNPAHPLPPWPLNRMDDNGDGVVNSADLIYEINWMFVWGAPQPHCSGFGRAPGE